MTASRTSAENMAWYWTSARFITAGILAAHLALTASCRDENGPKAPPPENLDGRATRFDEMSDDPAPTVSRARRLEAVVRARHALSAAFDQANTNASGVMLTQDLQSMEEAATRGEAVGIVERKKGLITLRLQDEKGPVFASFRAPPLETQRCWTTLWQPDWVPAVASGPGMGLTGKSDVVWWRFQDEEKPPFLVRFDPDGVAVWRPNTRDGCYRGESLLGLIGGGVRIGDYLSPVAATNDAEPDETEETVGTKPLHVDLLASRGKEMIVARNGVVELLTAKKKRVHRWKSTLPRGSAACTQAAYHRFEGDPVLLFFEVEFTDDEACDEVWERREVQQTLFEIHGGELVPVLSGGESTYGEGEDASGSALQLDVRVPTGDGRLRYVGEGHTRQDEAGGEKWYDCSAWAADLGLDAADTGYSEESYEGTWTFETDDAEIAVGKVGATVRTFQCSEAQP